MALIPFVFAASAVLITPGPTNTILAASGAAVGWHNSRLLPVAEALGYGIAISLYLMLAQFIACVPSALSILKGIVVAWLLLSAWKLWEQPVNTEEPARAAAFRRVFLTTLLNPKAMLVGTVLIPNMLAESPADAVTCFLALSLIAGAGWTLLGASLPSMTRPHAYKGAAMVLGAFAIISATGVLAA